MHALQRILLVIGLLIATGLLSVSCTDEIKMVQVHFDSREGSSLDAVGVPKGKRIAEPERPQREGYAFAGWYKESTCSTQWDFSTDVVEADITLYALWIPLCSITLDPQRGSGGTTHVTAVLGEPMPPDMDPPQRPGYQFCGYFDQAGSGGTLYYAADMSSVRNWDKTTGSTATLYAQWTPTNLHASAGGHIFFDKGSYSDGWQYLEAAPVSTQWVAKLWSSMDQFRFVGASGFGIGDGISNTQMLVDELGQDSEYAALLCANLSVEQNGVTYDDWFLPSHEELALMCQVLHQSGLGDFADTYYWSSSERSSAIALVHNFSDPTEPPEAAKTYSAHVRAIRAF